MSTKGHGHPASTTPRRDIAGEAAHHHRRLGVEGVIDRTALEVVKMGGQRIGITDLVYEYVLSGSARQRRQEDPTDLAAALSVNRRADGVQRDDVG